MQPLNLAQPRRVSTFPPESPQMWRVMKFPLTHRRIINRATAHRTFIPRCNVSLTRHRLHATLDNFSKFIAVSVAKRGKIKQERNESWSPREREREYRVRVLWLIVKSGWLVAPTISVDFYLRNFWRRDLYRATLICRVLSIPRSLVRNWFI